MFKIGIDLSTSNTGIVILTHNNVFMKAIDLTFDKYCEANLKTNISKINDVIGNLKNTKVLQEAQEIYVGLEVSNFKNANLTNKFHLYAGLIINGFVNTFGIDVVKFKIFNSNEWQKLIGCNNNDSREIRKAKARAFAKKHIEFYKSHWSEDVCDAFCIAYFLEQLKSTEEIKKDVQIRKKAKRTTDSYIKMLQKKIIVRQNGLLIIDKKKCPKKAQRIEDEIKEFKEEIERCKNLK